MGIEKEMYAYVDIFIRVSLIKGARSIEIQPGRCEGAAQAGTPPLSRGCGIHLFQQSKPNLLLESQLHNELTISAWDRV